jgi:hypothetical protein
MLRVLAALVAVGGFLLEGRAYACGRCEDELSLRSTSIRAGLVVVARQIGEKFSPVSGEHQWVTFATFEVQKVLKGWPIADQIDVGVSWMCGYGIHMDRGQSAVLFLERRNGKYFTVRDGCAVRSLPVVDGRVVLTDIELPVDAFAAGLGLAQPADTEPPGWPLGPMTPFLCLGACVAGVVAGRRVDR